MVLSLEKFFPERLSEANEGSEMRRDKVSIIFMLCT